MVHDLVEKMQFIFFVPPKEELEVTLHPQKFGCTPKNEKTCGYADEKHHVMIHLLINQPNISRDFSLQLSKCLVDSDLPVNGLNGIEPIRKISLLDWFLPYWPNDSFYIALTDLTIYRLINQS
jgi:hypothetical protein